MNSAQPALTQAAILKIFYEATGGPAHWGTLTGMENDSVICELSVVTCSNNTNTITKLDLSKCIKIMGTSSV
jgi:hypothetical protein